MAYEIPGFSYTLPAGVDLSALLFRAVDIDENSKAVLPAAGGRIVGVLNNRAKANEAATIIQTGIVQVEAGAAVTAGDDVEVDEQGRAITLAAGAKVGVAFESASAAGIIIAVLLSPAPAVAGP